LLSPIAARRQIVVIDERAQYIDCGLNIAILIAQYTSD
jgi:hypothetical protein